jgi:hypothetical protein
MESGCGVGHADGRDVEAVDRPEPVHASGRRNSSPARGPTATRLLSARAPTGSVRHVIRPRRVSGRGASSRRAGAAVDFDAALAALDVGALRSFVRTYAGTLDDEPRTALAVALVEHAARHGGYRPTTRGAEAVRAAERFAASAREVGVAEPSDVDDHLRAATAAFLARDYAAAHAIFEAILPPIAAADVDLGQHELVDEVLAVCLDDCAAAWLVSVYLTAPQGDRPAAVRAALAAVDGVATLVEPLAAMERVALEPLPGWAGFLPRWSALLERETPPDARWPERSWLRDAVVHAEGVAGLARASRSADDVRAWCAAVARQGGWTEVLRVNDEAATLVRSAAERADFHDEAALAARELGRADVAARLETAWRTAPTLVRLLRWLLAGRPDAGAIGARAKEARAACPRGAGAQRSLLAILVGALEEAAARLARAPGLGWSAPDHPGHLTFAALAWALGGAPPGSLREVVVRPLGTVPDDRAVLEEPGAPRLDTPAVVDVLRAAGVPGTISPAVRSTALEALRTAASLRVEGVLREKRRRHYTHAALLVGCCVELDPEGSARWVVGVRERGRRFPAFRGVLEDRLAAVKR